MNRMSCLLLANILVWSSLNGPGANQPCRAEELEQTDVEDNRFVFPKPLEDLGRGYKVRPVYFVPKDREPVADYEKKITVMLTLIADLYRRDLESKGYKTRGLDFEFQDGKLQVHVVRGKREAAFYSGQPSFNRQRLFQTLQGEVLASLGYPKHRLCTLFAETQGDGPLSGRYPGELARSAPVNPYAGLTVLSAWMLQDDIAGTTVDQQLRFMNDPTALPNIKPGGKERPRMELSQAGCGVVAHEMARTLFLMRDHRDKRNIMGFGYGRLRKSFLVETAKTQPVRFSDEHARFLAYSRYFSESFDESDGSSPTVIIKLVKDPQPGDREIRFSVKAIDNKGLAGLLYFESTLGCVVGGGPADGLRFEQEVVYQRPKLRAGQKLNWNIFAIDVNGNVGAHDLRATVQQTMGGPSG